jgi:hypothetical protein
VPADRTEVGFMIMLLSFASVCSERSKLLKPPEFTTTVRRNQAKQRDVEQGKDGAELGVGTQPATSSVTLGDQSNFPGFRFLIHEMRSQSALQSLRMR